MIKITVSFVCQKFVSEKVNELKFFELERSSTILYFFCTQGHFTLLKLLIINNYLM